MPRLSAAAQCGICPHRCAIPENGKGFCGARINRDGKIVSESYGLISSLALDPIEKKPLSLFHPGSTVLSLSEYGCNLKCPWCQNHRISFAGPDDIEMRETTPEKVVATALSLASKKCIGIAYTYNEPLIGFEFLKDTATLAHEHDLKNVLVSNGMVTLEALGEIAHLIDAANIDLKGFSQDFYDMVSGDYKTVRQTIETLAALPTCHLEVTTLVIPGLNDDPEQIDDAARWLASLDPEIVYHITRFFPAHKFTHLSATPVETIYNLAEVARKHLRNVRTGNC